VTTTPPKDHLERARFDYAVLLGAHADRLFADACRGHGGEPSDRGGSPLEWLALLRASPINEKRI